jgi:hypothetical protein
MKYFAELHFQVSVWLFNHALCKIGLMSSWLKADTYCPIFTFYTLLVERRWPYFWVDELHEQLATIFVGAVRWHRKCFFLQFFLKKRNVCRTTIMYNVLEIKLVQFRGNLEQNLGFSENQLSVRHVRKMPLHSSLKCMAYYVKVVVLRTLISCTGHPGETL